MFSPYFIGNKYLHILTPVKHTEMRVDMENFKGEKRYAKYSKFSIGDAASKYKLTVGGYSGNAGNNFNNYTNTLDSCIQVGIEYSL